jgi:hypothetical protein
MEVTVMTFDLLEEYENEYEMFIINQEAYEQIFQLECGFVNESMGLMSLQEGVLATIHKWFDKIVNAVQTIIKKLEQKIVDISEKQLKKYAKMMNDPVKLDPLTLRLNITNYHEYDFTKFRDGTFDASKAFNNPDFLNIIASIAGGGSGQKPEKVTKDDIKKAIYPQLYDEKLSTFDKMRELVLTTGKDNNNETLLNMDMLDNAWNYVNGEYRPLIDYIKKDEEALANQRKNVDAIAQQVANTVTAPTAPQQTQESFAFCEEYLFEADDQDKPVKDQKIDDGGSGGVSRETYARILMVYIQVAVDIISAKTKVVNTAFMDKFKIVIAYCKRAK